MTPHFMTPMIYDTLAKISCPSCIYICQFSWLGLNNDLIFCLAYSIERSTSGGSKYNLNVIYSFVRFRLRFERSLEMNYKDS